MSLAFCLQSPSYLQCRLPTSNAVPPRLELNCSTCRILVCVHTFVCTCACPYVCSCVPLSIGACLYVCACMSTYVHVPGYVDTCAFVYQCMHSCVHLYPCMYEHLCLWTCVPPSVGVCMHVYILLSVYKCVCTGLLWILCLSSLFFCFVLLVPGIKFTALSLPDRHCAADLYPLLFCLLNGYRKLCPFSGISSIRVWVLSGSLMSPCNLPS